MKRTKRLVSAVCAALLCLWTVLPVTANSAQTWWNGTDASGTVLTDTECPIVVEQEILTFDLPEFPQNYYRTAEEFTAYSGQVTAEYTFYNPADYTVTARLLFPFGNLPDYHAYIYTEETRTYDIIDDTAKFDVTVNGEAIEKTLRHTLKDRYDKFELEKDLANLHDGYMEDAFYTPDMPVTKYTYTVSGIDEETYPAANAAFDVEPFGGKTKILFEQQSGRHMPEKTGARISAWAENGMTLTVYAIGEPFEDDIQWTFYKNGGVENGEEITGTAALTETASLTFGDLACRMYPAEGNILRSDWYNAAVQSFNRSEDECGVIMLDGMATLNLSGSLMRWYEYEIVLAPGERIVNAVSAPMYPTIDGDWEPPIYTYTYLLSPAKTWASFGNLEVLIHTPFHMTDSSAVNWEKTETGYRKVSAGLPLGELEFALCAEADPKISPHNVAYVLPILGGIAVIVLCVLLVCGGITAVIVIAVRRRKRTTNE